jgi:monoamine oxidase
VELVPERLRTEPRETTALHVQGQFVPLSQWESSPLNPHPDALRKLPPLELDGWQSPANVALDVPVASRLRELGLNDETIRLANQFSSYGTNLWQSSLLQLCHVFSFSRVSAQISQGRRGALSVRGGNQRMPEAMAGAVRGNILLGRAVGGIRMSSDGVEVRCDDGSLHRAICASVGGAPRAQRIDALCSSSQLRTSATAGRCSAVGSHSR